VLELGGNSLNKYDPGEYLGTLKALTPYFLEKAPGLDCSVLLYAVRARRGELLVHRFALYTFVWDLAHLTHTPRQKCVYPLDDTLDRLLKERVYVLRPKVMSKDYYARSPLDIEEHMRDLKWQLVCLYP
jgi:hypothetical protein